MSFTPIDRNALQPDQWVVFSHDTKEMPKEVQGPFKVINRDDALFDECRCFLMNVEGQLFDYCPRMRELGDQVLPLGYNVKVADKEWISKKLGEKIKDIQD